MKKRVAIFIGGIGAVFGLTTCQQTPETVDLVQNMFVQTSYDNAANFSTYASYALPLDTVGQIYNYDPNDTLIVGPYATLITGQVKANMDHAGYTRVDLNQNPDLGINVFVVRDYNVFQSVTYPGYYGGYSGYYYPGYYGYGGYYGYPYLNYSSVNTATLVIEMVDLKNKDSQNKVKVIWIAYMGDLFATVDLFQKSQEAVDQSFKQSAYIKK